MSLPNELPANVKDECGYVAFNHYNWNDISCNFGNWGYHIAWNPAVFCIYSTISTLALWMSIVLIIKTTLRFKRRNTLYFWSLVGVAFGIICYTLSFLLRCFIAPDNTAAFPVPYAFGQLFILSGFGLVMYSRLHLITQSRILLRCLLIMIIVIAVIGHTTTFVQLVVISLGKELLSMRIYHAVAYLDVIFTAQDLVLQSFYIYFFWKHLEDSSQFATTKMKRNDKTTFWLLIVAYAVVVSVDIISNVLLCLKIYVARSMVFPLLCAIKLEVEFLVLNRLAKIAATSSPSLGSISVTTVLEAKRIEEESSQGTLEEINEISPPLRA